MSKQKELQESKSELDYILDFVETQLEFKPNESKTEFTKSIQGPPSQIIINGQRSVQPGESHSVTIRYIGEGSISNSKESIPIWGFEIDQDGHGVSATEYVDGLDQFKQLFS